MSKYQIPVPTESIEQQQVFAWAAYAEAVHPDLRWLYHIPNEGKRSRATGGRLKAEGLKPGVPDICLPVPRGHYHGLYIELKRVRGSKTTPAQLEWLAGMKAQGHATALCKGAEAAIETIKQYLKLPKED